MLSQSNARKEYFFPIYSCKITNGFLWSGKTRVTQNGCVVSLLFFQVQNVTQAPSPSSPFHSSTALLEAFFYNLVIGSPALWSCIWSSLLYMEDFCMGWDKGGVASQYGRVEGVLPGSTGVLRVACPWVRCRAPPEQDLQGHPKDAHPQPPGFRHSS